MLRYDIGNIISWKPPDILYRSVKITFCKYLFWQTRTSVHGFWSRFTDRMACCRTGKFGHWHEYEGTAPESNENFSPTLSQGEGTIYDLQGCRLNKASQKGIYIQDGKKRIPPPVMEGRNNPFWFQGLMKAAARRLVLGGGFLIFFILFELAIFCDNSYLLHLSSNEIQRKESFYSFNDMNAASAKE